jgi:hypothetical protein
MGESWRNGIGYKLLWIKPRSRTAIAAKDAMHPASHRDQLVTMLAEAAEIEHCLMCTYLYAAFSLKQREDEGLLANELEAVQRRPTRRRHL